jgi:hypothetical protein
MICELCKKSISMSDPVKKVQKNIDWGEIAPKKYAKLLEIVYSDNFAYTTIVHKKCFDEYIRTTE